MQEIRNYYDFPQKREESSLKIEVVEDGKATIKYKAKIKDGKVICGLCGARLFDIKFFKVENGVVDFGTPVCLSEIEVKKLSRKKAIITQLYIKCKHKSQSKYCDTINEILL